MTICWRCEKHEVSSDGRECSACRKTIERDTESSYERFGKYGLTKAEFELMSRRQNSRCEICTRRCELVIDHDHETGKVRGLLCFRCNSALGFFQDDTTALQKALDYLREGSEYIREQNSESTSI